MAVSQSFTIKDKMSAKLDKIRKADEKVNKAMETTERLSESVNPGQNFEPN